MVVMWGVIRVPMSRRLMVGAIIAATTALSPAYADVRAGVDAWQNGNYPAAIREWRPLAEKGDPDAQFNLAQAYKLGRGVAADLKQAQNWFEKASAQGHEEAQANLGLILFQNGEQEAGMVWIRKAADNGDPRARYILATALFNGDMMEKDLPRAYALMNRAAAQGLMAAAESLSQMENVISEADRQQGMKVARDLAGADAIRDSSALASNSMPRPVEQPAAPAPKPPAVVPMAAPPAEVAPASDAPTEPATVTPPSATADSVAPTWRSGRAPKAARPPRQRAAKPAPAAPESMEVASNSAPSPAEQPTAPVPAPTAVDPPVALPATQIQVAAAPTGDPPAADQPTELASAAPPSTTAETVTPTWRSGRAARAARPQRQRAAKPATAPAEAQSPPEATATPQETVPSPEVPVQVAAADAAPMLPTQPIATAPESAAPQPVEVSAAAPVETTPATAPVPVPEAVPAPAAAAEVPPATVDVAAAAPASPVIEATQPTPVPPVEVATAAPAPPMEAAPVPTTAPAAPAGEFAAAVLPAPPAMPVTTEPVPTAPVEAEPAPEAVPAQPVELASAAPDAAPPEAQSEGIASAAPFKRIAKPAPKTPPRPLTSVNGKWRVQLGAYGSMDLAKGRWSNLARKSVVLTGLKPSYEPAGALTRLRVNALTDRSAADKVCAAVKAAGQACFPIAP